MDKASPREGDLLPKVIENNVSIGSNWTILPVHIFANTFIGTGPFVKKDIRTPGIYARNPEKLIRKMNLKTLLGHFVI